jgi:TRAP-type C4-dicarboxylate transport system permease large subunit
MSSDVIYAQHSDTGAVAMDLAARAYPALVYAHLLLFVLWLGADVGVFMLGQHFRKRDKWSLDQRIALLTLLVEVDMIPRSAWALMVPLSLSVVEAGGWWDVPGGLLAGAWGVGLGWLWLVWDSHRHDQTPRAARNRRIEGWLRWLVGGFYLWLGGQSLLVGAPLEPDWLALKALLFGCIFVAAIMIDVTFKPVGVQLAAVLTQGSSDATEIPLRRTMDRTRIWVFAVYLLLVATAFLGNAKPL